MKHFQPLFAATALAVVATACNPSAPNYYATGDYAKRSELDGVPRSEAVMFTIGDTAYVGTGYQGYKRLRDFWGYNATSNTWSQKADLPGPTRSQAVAFAIGDQGYVGTGYDGRDMLNDFWRFNQATNTWQAVAPFAGSARYDAVAFAIGQYGYVTTGFDGGHQKDLWRFDPAGGPNGKWLQKTSLGGEKRTAAIAFVHGTKGYVVTGTNNGQACGDFWCYDVALDEWQPLKSIYNQNTTQAYDDNYTDIKRDNGVGFVIGDSAYITSGEASLNGNLLTSTWLYDFAADRWTPRSPFQGTPRQGAVGFALNGHGFFGTGQSGTQYFDDLILFDPNKPYNSNDYH